jgi:hypothetical protein
MEDVHPPGRLREQNGISKEEILLTWKVTGIRIRLFGSIRRSTEPKSDSLVSTVVQQDLKSDSSVSKVVQQLPYWIEALQGSKVIPKQP